MIYSVDFVFQFFEYKKQKGAALNWGGGSLNY